MYKNGKQYDKFILNGKTYEKFYLNNKQYGGGYVPFATPILDLDFQNNFIDKSPSALNMVQGKGLPTFGLSGRKTGEYCAIFNGAQSIKTNINLPLNSDKVCIKFWMKTTQTGSAIVTEMSPNLNSNNAFYITINESANKIWLADRASNYNIGISVASVNTGSWIHVICIIDRSFGVNQNKIYINGVLSFVQNTTYYSNNNGNFVNNILFLGQRAGNAIGYVGSLMKYQAFRAVPTDAQAMEIYQNDL